MSDTYTITYPKTGILSSDKKVPYLLDEKLGKAVEVAISLNMPLLLTGEPGTGKTRLAEKIALDLSSAEGSQFLPEPLVFNTKTTSSAKELFYQYDALRHFHDANLKIDAKKTLTTSDYIQLHALGEAIALTNPSEIGGAYLNKKYEACKSSVVLIDEIDKAPRDFPNDILAEIERFQFEIKETNNYLMEKGANHQIVLIMTSNSEKNLPEAFLRRVIFYHISFPGPKQLAKIVNSHLEIDIQKETDKPKAERVKQLVALFQQIRQEVRKKRPATAELIAWMKILKLEGFLQRDIDINGLDKTSEDWKILERSFSILAKTQIDKKALTEMRPAISVIQDEDESAASK